MKTNAVVFSKRRTIVVAAAARGFAAIRPIFFPAFVALAVILPILFMTHDVYIRRPYGSSRILLLYIPLLSKGRIAALAGLAFVLLGGLLGYRRARWMPKLGYGLVAFTAGSITAAFLLGLIDAVLKVFSHTMNGSVAFICHNPIGLIIGLLLAVVIGIGVGILGFILILPFILLWKEPGNVFLRAARISIGVLLLAGGLYFIIFFDINNYDWFNEYAAAWHSVMLYSLALVALALGLVVTLRTLFSPMRKKGWARRVSLLLLVLLVFLCHVEVFGIWLENNDVLYNSMNGLLSRVEVVGSTYSKECLPVMRYSPDGSKLVLSKEFMKRPYTDRVRIINEKGALLQRVDIPPLEKEWMITPEWSPNSRMLAGISEGQHKPGIATKGVLWTYNLDSSGYAETEFYMMLPLLYYGMIGWSPGSESIAVISHSRAKILETERVYESADFDLYAETETQRSEDAILMYDAKTLELRKKIPVESSCRWVMFVDDNTILYCGPSSQGQRETSVENRVHFRFKEINLRTVREMVIPIIGDADISPLNPPLLVRKKHWLLTSLELGDTRKPYLVELSTGKLEQVRGLTGDNVMLSGIPWLYARSDSAGGRVVLQTVVRDTIWPHQYSSRNYIWEDGKKDLKEFEPLLKQKTFIDIDGDGDKVAFGWNWRCYTSRLPERSER